MKRMRSALSLTITAALVLLSPGGSAWAQFAESATSARVGTAGSASAAGVTATRLGAGIGPSLSISAPTAFAPSVAPSLAAPAPSALVASPSAAPALTAVPAAALPSAVPAASPAAVVPAATPAAAPALAPSASAMDGARRELPDFSKMSSGDSKGAASADFMARVGQTEKASAPALDSVPAASAGMSRSFLSKAIGSTRVRAAAAVAGVVPFAAAVAHGGASLVTPLLTLPLVLVSLVLHEIGHAKAAKALGDPTATLQGRASFNPLTWGRHVDPMMTIVVPVLTFLTTGFIFGGAKPVPVDSSYFKRPIADMAKVAFAGPAVNLALAALGALAFAGATAAAMSPIVLTALSGFVFVNALLAVFNLMPILPLDGGHILMALLPRATATKVAGFYARIGMLGMLPIMLIAMTGGGLIMGAAAALTHFLIGASFAITGVQMASAALPAMAALGLALGQLGGARQPGVKTLTAAAAPATPPSGPGAPGAASGGSSRPVDLVVVFSSAKSLTKDLHLSAADSRDGNFVQSYEGIQRGLLGQLNAVGLTADALASYDATPVASYARINAATIRVDASKAAEFEAALKAQGHKVYPNDRRKIITPVPVTPEDADPSARNPVSMAENLKITGADQVQAIVEKRYGKPDLNPWRKLKKFFGAEQAPQPLIGVVDSGADLTHPLLKRVKEVKNATSGENIDDIGHGSWVTSMVLNYAPWAKNVTHYKTFLNGGASLDDILKALTMAANDGNLVISNSWGSDDGDPTSPDSLLVQKLASEGHIMVFAAGNAGPGANTVGSPAIVQYKDAATGAIRVIAVAATDRNKKVAYFSSRGPGSPKTVGKDGFAHRPDLAALGYNTEGAWPAALGDADRTDPEAGPLKAISGTSMSTPSVAGAIALLLIAFGVTEKGAKLDAVVNAVTTILEKTGKNGVNDEGQGFLNLRAVYEALYKLFYPDSVPPTALARYRRVLADEKSIKSYLYPSTGPTVAVPAPPNAKKMMLDDLRRARAEKEALEAEYPGIAHAAKGPVARAWATLTGRAPIPDYVSEYRLLIEQVLDDQDAQKAYLRSATALSAGVREEMLEHFYTFVEPEYAARRARLEALLKSHPTVEYDAAGPLARLWMRWTGKGPRS